MYFDKKIVIVGMVLMITVAGFSGCINKQKNELQPIVFMIEDLSFNPVFSSNNSTNISSLTMLADVYLENPNDESITLDFLNFSIIDESGETLFSFKPPANGPINCPAISDHPLTLDANQNFTICCYKVIRKNATCASCWEMLNSEVEMRLSGYYKLKNDSYYFQSNSGKISERIDSELSLQFYLKKQKYSVDEPINVKVSIFNNRNYSINTSVMGLDLETLDFEIYTPDNKTLHYIGSTSMLLPDSITIKPDESYSVTIDIKEEEFGYFNGTDYVHYNFTKVGKYKIKAFYNSSMYWNGPLTSNTEFFTIGKSMEPAMAPIVLDFCEDCCDDENVDPYNTSQLGIQNITWINDTAVNIKAYVSINCAFWIEDVGFHVNEDTIFLTYYVHETPYMARCICAHGLSFTLKGLEKDEYNFELEPIFMDS